MQITVCPNCNTPLKNNLLSSVRLLDSNKTAVINEYNQPKHAAYCTKCGQHLYIFFRQELIKEKEVLATNIIPGVSYIPAITISNPNGWEYDILNVVTAHAVTGTGSMSVIEHTMQESLEEKPSSLQNKLKAEEHLCYFRLKRQALDCGGNAVVDISITYAQFNGDQVMINMAGTAIRLKNSNVLGETLAQRLNNLAIYNKRYLHITKLKDRAESTD